MGQLNWTEEANRWLREIYDYIAADNPRAAKRTVEAIHKKAELLLRFPEYGYRYENDRGRGIRIILYGHYRIAYLIKTENDIDILGVYHAALDIERLL